MKKTIIYYTEDYKEFAEELLDLSKQSGLNWQLGNIERKVFPDNEYYLRILDNIMDSNVILVGSPIDNKALEIYDLGCAISKLGAYKLTLLMPYFSYSTMERSVKEGEVVTAKTRCRLFSSIPQTPGGNEIVLLDLHSEGIPYYFESNIKVFHLYAKKIWLKLFPQIMNNEDYVLASTDAGRAKWVESLANDLGVEPAFIYKKRNSGTSTKVMAVNANVQNKNVLIYDDMIRTGGSLIGAANAYKQAGAKDIYAVTTHGIFPMDAEHLLITSGLFKEIHCTNSYPKKLNLIKKHSVVSIFFDFLITRDIN